MKVIETEEMILPANNIKVDFDNPSRSHPRAANGETISIIFFRPIQSEMSPPIGVKIIAQK